MLNVVLVQPEIPANTGNVGRTCVLAGARLHLVGPLGFDLSQRALKRAGLAYWESLDYATYTDWDDFLRRNPSAPDHMHLLTKEGPRRHTDASFGPDDYLVFGKESTGLDACLLAKYPERCERIPMMGDDTLSNADSWHERHRDLHPELAQDVAGNFVDTRSDRVTSLNLSNAVAIVLFEALRQLDYPGMR